MEITDQHTALRSKLEMCQRALEQLAGDINNNLGQVAATIKIRLNIIQLQPIENNQKNIDEIKDLLSELIKGLQDIAGNKVNSIILDLPKI